MFPLLNSSYERAFVTLKSILLLFYSIFKFSALDLGHLAVRKLTNSWWPFCFHFLGEKAWTKGWLALSLLRYLIHYYDIIMLFNDVELCVTF